MDPRIAIPLPLSTDPDYVERSLPQYERAVDQAGGEPVRISLGQSAEVLRKIIETCHGVLLPGSKIDVDPAKYGASKHARTAPADPKRDAVDWSLLEHAYAARKPVLGICYGLQSLNVYRAGTLIQHIPDFLAPQLQVIDHAAGRTVPVAHEAEIDPASTLAQIVANGKPHQEGLRIPVNSSHHQAAEHPGTSLRIVARCPNDGIIEALEGTAPDHFVLAVQWHPERSVDNDEPSRAIFRSLIEAARASAVSRKPLK
jgi:putative glutamine amidotransferase